MRNLGAIHIKCIFNCFLSLKRLHVQSVTEVSCISCTYTRNVNNVHSIQVLEKKVNVGSREFFFIYFCFHVWHTIMLSAFGIGTEKKRVFLLTDVFSFRSTYHPNNRKFLCYCCCCCSYFRHPPHEIHYFDYCCFGCSRNFDEFRIPGDYH